MSDHQDSYVTRFFKTRVQQQLIGKLPNGARIPGGPYTLTQVAGGGALGIGGLWLKSQGLWSLGGPVIDMIVLVALVAGFVMLLKHTVSAEPQLLKMRLKGWSALPLQSVSTKGIFRGRPYAEKTKGTKVRGTVRINPADLATASPALQLQPISPSAEEQTHIRVQPSTPETNSAAPINEPLPEAGRRKPRTGLEHLLATAQGPR